MLKKVAFFLNLITNIPIRLCKLERECWKLNFMLKLSIVFIFSHALNVSKGLVVCARFE